MISKYIQDQPEAWLSWFLNNHDVIKSDSEWFARNLLQHARELGYGMTASDLKNIGLLYGCCIVRPCLKCALPVPVSNKAFVAEIMNGYRAANEALV